MSMNTQPDDQRIRPSAKAEKPLLISIRIDPQTLAALDAWRGAQPYPNPTRAEAGRFAVKAWLTSMGLLKPANGAE